MKRLASVVLFIALAACSKKAADLAPVPATGSGSAVGSAAVAPPPADAPEMGSDAAVAAGSGEEDGGTEFDKLTSQQKADFMKKNVMPPMKAAFQKFDAKKYANFSCKTCHGKDPKGSKYKMPNPQLPKLDFAALQAGKQKPETAEFMTKIVKPEMAKILGEKELDMAHPEAGGFGCLECHEQKKK